MKVHNPKGSALSIRDHYYCTVLTNPIMYVELPLTKTAVGLCKVCNISLVPRLFPPPVFHHSQYEIQRGKALEIWSRAMRSSRHMVDTVPNEESRLPVLYCPSNGWLAFARPTINIVRCSQRRGRINAKQVC